MKPWPALLCCATLCLQTVGAEAEESEAETTLQARAAFERGTAHVRDSKWALAHAAFVEANTLRPHAITEYNLGACERAMGQYIAARQSFERALARHVEHHELTPDLSEQLAAFQLEANALVGKVTYVIRAPKRGVVRMLVDGRPLERRSDGAWVAGLRAAASAEPVLDQGVLEVDPGHHVVVISSENSHDSVNAFDIAAGERLTRTFLLRPAPATLHLDANVAATALLDGQEIGVTPLVHEISSGRHQLRLERTSYVPYSTEITAMAGKPIDLRATLTQEKIPITKRWWFWTLLGGAALGIGATTYVLTQPEPTRPPISGGSLGWVVPVPNR